MHGRLLTNSQRARRRLSDSDTCQRCTLSPEIVLHALRDYQKARHIWNKFMPHTFCSQFFTADITTWISFNLKSKCKTHHVVLLSLLFGFTAWFIWNSKSKKLFDNKKSSQDLILHCTRLAQSFLKANNCQRQLEMEKRKGDRNNCVWLRPSGDCVKINVDGAYDST